MSDNTAVRAAKLDKIFGTPVCAVLLAIFCNVLWGSAFPFIILLSAELYERSGRDPLSTG